MKMFRRSLPILFLTTIARAQLATPAAVPENLGLGLRELVELSQIDQAGLQRQMQTTPAINSDTAGRVTANIQLDGKVPLAEIQANLIALGLEVIAVEDHWRKGVISVRLPLSAATAAANVPGVRSITLARKPVRRVGVVTAESSVAEHAAEVNTPGIMSPQGIIGRNISVGIVSDSFDGASNVPRASVAVASGDLPGPGNPDGYTQPVVVLKDDSGADATDEGRGMAEIVHDIAPAAKISFSACGATQATMAASIRNLRTSSATLCDIIVDDIGFADEPFFSDGIISQAIDDVATSNSLAGKKVAFFSAAGNTDNHGYDATAHIVSVAAGLSSSAGNVKLNQVPSSLYAGGFQGLDPNGTPSVVMSVTTDADPGELVFQWDDPFNTGGVTTDYNLLVFDAAGNYLSSVSGKDNNFSTSEPVEIVDLSPNTTYKLVISLASANPPTATHLRMISFGQGAITGPNLSSNVISLFGHPAAANANAVAAYVYDNTPNVVSNYNPNQTNPPPGPYAPVAESFNALGGNVPFYFDSQGNRLASPQIRQKPEFAAADGVDTSFFPPDDGADSDNDGFPNFFGTSAAAPNAAAFAALLLEAAGGSQSLSPTQIRDRLAQSTFPHDLDPSFARATISAANSSLDLTASGDDSNDSATNPSFFTLHWENANGAPLQQVTIDLSHTALVFDPRSDLGFPFTVGQNSGGVSVTSNLSADMRVLTLNFGNTFTPGKTIAFGIDRDLAGINASGNSADNLGGASVAAVVDPNAPLFTAFNNQLGHGFSPADGQGLIDAKAAVETVVGHKSAFNGVSVNLATRGNVSTGDDVLIGGLIIDNSATKNIIIRALGPSIAVPGALPDPTLELRDQNGGLIMSNNNWQDDPVQAAQIQATGIPPKDPRESAIVRSLNPGSYTAIVRGANSATGIGLVEVYDLDPQPAASHLANIATRGVVELNDNVLIAGFILQQGTSQVAVRAIGPSAFPLAPATPSALADPTLELRDVQGNLVTSNDNWQEDSFQAVQLSAVALAPTSPVESALMTTLPSGSYTAIVRGAHGTTGNAVVEIYNVH
ncbi:MAG: S8 family serine peptidase [Chthoniobacterales bacterium]